MTRATARLALVVVIGIGGPVLAACGGDDDATAEREETATDDGGASTESTATDADETTEESADAGATDDAAMESGEQDDETTEESADAGATDDAVMASGEQDESAADEADGSAAASGGTIDGSDIDWATVDLTTIDWENIDFATVDVDALATNPTVENLSEETIALVQERYASEVGAGGSGDAGSGRATLTIGDETWEFDDFVCAFGYANTQSDVFSFSSNAFGTLADGTRTQLQANIWDETGSDALTGPDTDHEITFDDIDNFDDPAVDWLMTGTELTIDGTRVSVDAATFRDLGTGEEQPGSFVGDCGAGSRL